MWCVSPIQKEVDDVAMNDPVFGKRDLVAGNHQLGIVVANSGEVAEFAFPVAVGDFIGNLNIELLVVSQNQMCAKLRTLPRTLSTVLKQIKFLTSKNQNI